MSNSARTIPLPLRSPFLSPAGRDRIVNGKCFHIDIHLRHFRDGEFYYVFVTSRGGIELIKATCGRVTNDGELVAIPYSPDILNALPRYINVPLAKTYPHVVAAHYSHIKNTVRTVPPGFRAPNSVRLHYVFNDPAIDDPMAGLPNHWLASGRGERWGDDRQRPGVAVPPSRASKRKPYTAADRAMLRTLDKLLKP